MATVKSFEDLEIWKLSKSLCKELLPLCKRLQTEKNYRLLDQIQGSSGSIMDNIAEGFEREGKLEFIKFLYYSKGSSGELLSQLHRCTDNNYLSSPEFEKFRDQIKSIGRMENSLIEYLKKSELQGRRKKDISE